MLNENKIWLATGNSHKFREARNVLEEYGVQLEHMNIERVEIQSDDPAEIAAFSLSQIDDDGRPIVCEDAGLFIDHYGGFPGPYSSYALEKLGNPGILKLLKDIEDRRAFYQSALALRINGEIHYFSQSVKGIIAHRQRGTGGFGYDPIFIPDEGDSRTFAEMTEEEKNAISHRARAFRSLGIWLSNSK